MKRNVDEKGIIYLEQPRVPAISLVISLFSLLLISLGAFSILALQQPLNQSQNTTSQASIKNGPVVLGSQQFPNQFLTKQNNSVIITANTNGYQTQGIVAIFNVITSSTDSLDVKVLSNSNLKASTQEIQKTTNGFLVKVTAEPAGTAPFSSTTALPFLSVTFNPYNSGAFNLAFDQVYSHSYLANSRQEELGIVPLMNFNVADSGTTANSSCNQSCKTNHDCPTNLFCYSNGQCRSATDPTNSTCPITTVSADRVCNQNCDNSAECVNGLSCFNNHCRVPGNPDSTVCSTVTQVVYTAIVSACNQSCTTNRDCAINLRCYSGACRLATNTSSLTCTPSDVPIITSAYPPDANLLAGAKGQEIVIPSASPSATIVVKPATSSATVKPSTIPFVWPSPVPVVIVTPAPKATTQPAIVNTDTNNPLTNLLAKLRLSSGSSGISFPLIAVIAGVVLLIIALLFLLRKKTPATMKPPTANQPGSTMPQPARPDSPAVQTLEQRIAQLKSAQPTPGATLTTSAPVTPTPAAATSFSPSVSPAAPDNVSVPPSALSLQAAPIPAKPVSAINSSTMMQRLKDKGLVK